MLGTTDSVYYCAYCSPFKVTVRKMGENFRIIWWLLANKVMRSGPVQCAAPRACRETQADLEIHER